MHRMLHPLRTAIVALLLTASALALTPVDDAHPQSRLIRLSNGLTLNYLVQGSPQGQPIVLLHGAGDSWHSWDQVLSLIPSSYRVYAITLRGHGWSDHPQTGFERADVANDIALFLKALDLHQVTLAGHSLGSLVAQKVAADDDGRIARVILIGSGPGIRDPQARKELAESFGALRDPIDFTFARDFQASTIYAPVPPQFFETLVAEALKAPAATWHGLATQFQHDEEPQLLEHIRVPVLLLWGDHDGIFTRADQQQLLQRIPHAELKVYAETGHALHWERPTDFAADLLHFIASSK